MKGRVEKGKLIFRATSGAALASILDDWRSGREVLADTPVHEARHVSRGGRPPGIS